MNPFVKLAATAQPGEKKFILFAGAGLSKDAGIPTAWGKEKGSVQEFRKTRQPPFRHPPE
jgi:NAD-dependent SIR2 family protein deacetylase